MNPSKFAASTELQRPSGRRPDEPLPRYRVCPHCKRLVDDLTGCPTHGAVDAIWSAVRNEMPAHA